MPEYTIDPASILPIDPPRRAMAQPTAPTRAPTAGEQEASVQLEQLQLRVEQLEMHRRNDLRRILKLEEQVATLLEVSVMLTNKWDQQAAEAMDAAYEREARRNSGG